MKKWMTILLALLMALTLAACASTREERTEQANDTAATETEPEPAPVTEPEQTEEAPEEPAAPEEIPEPEETAEAESEDAESRDAEPETEGTPEPEEAADTEGGEHNAAGLPADASGQYVDFDDMSFYINGVKYTLGVSTLQEMIDNGVPFDENDIANAGNNLNPNYQSSGFRITLGDYWSAQVYVLNDTDSNKPSSECYINEIYLPVHSGESQDVLRFAFPIDVTMEDLAANAGEPDEDDHYDGDDGFYMDTYTYKKASSVYYGSSKYKFEFIKGELNYITITYMP